MKKLYGLLALSLSLFSPLIHAQDPGDLDLSFSPGSGITSGVVLCTATQSDDKILIGGSFSAYNGIGRSSIVRVNPDGSIDQAFYPGAGVNGSVSTIVVQNDGKILIGGSFSSCNGISRNNIARLNSDGILDGTFNPGSGSNSEVVKIAIQEDGKILIGGYFQVYNGISRNYIARINSNGSLDASFNIGAGANGPVLSLGLQSDGKIIIGGYFQAFNNTGRSRIARLNLDGSLDQTFNNSGSGLNSAVRTIAIQPDGKVIVGGEFTFYYQTVRNYLARLNADGTLDSEFLSGGSRGPNSRVFSTNIQDDGKIIVSGEFTSIDGEPAYRLLRLTTTGKLDPGFSRGFGADNIIRITSIQPEGKLVIGGDFNSYKQISRNRIARIYLGNIIADNIPPVPRQAELSNVTAQCQVNFEDLSIPTSTDNIDGTIQGITDSTIFPITAQGTTTITWTYTDKSGNSSSQTQNIIIQDTEIPIISPVEDFTKVLDVGQCEANLNIQGGNLILWNKLGSLEEVTNSAYGPDLLPGSGMLFEEGQYGSGLYVPMVQGIRSVHSPYTPRNIVPLGSFSIEFWYKRTHDDEHDGHSFVSAAYENNGQGTVDFTAVTGYGTDGWALYGSVSNNDGETVARYKHLLETQENWEAFFPKNEWIHLAFVHEATWPGGERIKIFRNGVELEGVIADFDSGYMGHVGQYGQGGFRIGNFVAWDSWGAGGVIDNIKLWDYGKTDFSDRFDEFSSGGDFIKKPLVTDNCGQVVALGTRSDGLPLDSPYPVGVTTITWTAVDEAGNEAIPVVQTITLRDQGIPVIGEVSSLTQSADPGLCTAAIAIIAPSVSDDCSFVEPIASRSDSLDLDQPFGLGVTTITWTAMDSSGNLAEPVYQTVTVLDDQKPVIGQVLAVSQSADADLCEAQVSIVPPIVTDNCNELSAIGSRSDGLALDASYPVGTTTITWSAKDSVGNAADPVMQTVTINDGQKPVIESAASISQPNDPAQCGATLAVVPPLVLDNCSSIAAVGARSDGLPLDSMYPVGLTVITWTAQDSAGNMADEVMQEIIVSDAEAPIVLTKNLEFTIEVGQSVTITPQDVDNGSSDNCAINSLVLSKSTFTDLDEGLNEVLLTATDAAGNSSSASATVTIIVDRSCKVRVLTKDVTLLLDKSGQATIKASDADNGSYSECSGSGLSLTLSKSIFTCADLGSQEAVLTATDNKGNQGSASFTVTVVDNLAPEISNVPKTLKVSLEANSSYVVPDFRTQYLPADNCAVVTYSQVPAPGTTWNTEGTYLVTLTATDHSGNSVAATISIEIRVSKPKGGTKPKSNGAGSRNFGSEEMIGNLVLVYPNPATSEASLEVRLLNPDDVIIKVIDVHGRGLFYENGFRESSFIQKIDLKGFAKGLYLIQVQIGFEVVTKRLVIE